MRAVISQAEPLVPSIECYNAALAACEKGGAPDRRGVSNRGMLGAMFCARVCAAVAQQTIWTILALYVEAALGWSASQFGLVLMGAAVIYAYTQLALFNKLQQRYGLAPLGAAASLLLATGQLMFAPNCARPANYSPSTPPERRMTN